MLGLTKDVQSHCKICKLCQFHKKSRKKYGKLPIEISETMLWGIVQVELVGPWKVKTPSGVKPLSFFTATMLETTYFCHTWGHFLNATVKKLNCHDMYNPVCKASISLSINSRNYKVEFTDH
jgi:hypothetical protein